LLPATLCIQYERKMGLGSSENGTFCHCVLQPARMRHFSTKPTTRMRLADRVVVAQRPYLTTCRHMMSFVVRELHIVVALTMLTSRLWRARGCGGQSDWTLQWPRHRQSFLLSWLQEPPSYYIPSSVLRRLMWRCRAHGCAQCTQILYRR
jgi:hypothetical protein